MTEITRPEWAESSPEMQKYYDEQWGIETHDDRQLFEMLCLETYQAGLSWQTVLRKQQAFEAAFFNYDINQVAKMTDTQLEKLLQNPAIIRNRRKLAATINNAQVIQQLPTSFDEYIWQFVDGKPQRLLVKSAEELPAQTRLSIKVSKQMKKDGFQFVGPVTVYSYLLAIGIVNARV